MTVSRARQMYTHGSWTVPEAQAYLERRYSAERLATELVDQWELHNSFVRIYAPEHDFVAASGIPREDLIALISTAYECKGITQLEAERLFRLLGMDVRESRSHLQMVDDNTLIVAIFGTPPTCNPSKKVAIMKRLADLMNDPPGPPDPIESNADLTADGPTYPNCDDSCRTCTNNACDMYREN